MKAIIMYWSATGNTEKVVNTIQRSLAEEKVTSRVIKILEAGDVDLYEYDLVLLGSPSYQFLPPEPVLNFIKKQMKRHNERGDIKPCAPKLPGKWAVVFCTYSGPHTGINEAIPVGKYLGQFCEHLGFEIRGEWYIVGEFHGRSDLSTTGRLGNIIGRPNESDLAQVETNIHELIKSIRSIEQI
jgi:flavodoxin